jgi:hypothetical protein
VSLSLPSRPFLAALPPVLCLATVAVALALSPMATAAPRIACPHSSAHHLGQGTRACHPKTKGHHHAIYSTARGHHATHSRAKGRHATHRKAHAHHVAQGVGSARGHTKGTATSPAAPDTSEAVCEDGSAPIVAGDGTVACQDGSEPMCEDGTAARPSSDGSTPVCETAPASGSVSTAARCEDGVAPILLGDGSFACEDGSEPTCEGTAQATPSSDGSAFVCELVGSRKSAG